MNDRIEKRIELKSPVARVWSALSDSRQFGAWFGVDLKAPFVAGQPAQGQMTIKGYEHITWRVVIQQMEPEKLLSFTWHPHAIDPQADYSAETPTLVEFRLHAAGTGTLLIVTESGFDKVPAGRRDEALRMNDRGWGIQLTNIECYVTHHA
jgi:uncharacterized protein YndB with AHSA1/START domain